MSDKDKSKKNLPPALGIILPSIVGLWILAGFFAVIKSLMCLNSSSSLTDKAVGILLAFSFGPFYFFYLYYKENYCV